MTSKQWTPSSKMMLRLLRPPPGPGYHVSPKRRREIIERDGPACFYCRAELDACEITMDHVKPRADGGTSAPDNLRVACRGCNSSKGTRAWPYPGSGKRVKQ